jgi:hypothetical protein
MLGLFFFTIPNPNLDKRVLEYKGLGDAVSQVLNKK